MMKRLLLFFLLLSAYTVQAQTYQTINVYGYQYKRVAMDSAFGIPKDTFSIPVGMRHLPHISAKDTALYVWSPALQMWRLASAGGSGGVATAWGQLTGSMSSQTDLQTALNAKQNLLTSGTALQYRKGDHSLGTFSTDVLAVGNPVFAPINHGHNGLIPPGGLPGQILKKKSISDWDMDWYYEDTTASAVASVHGRTGAVTAQSGDYSAYYKPLSYVPAWSEITSKPTTLSGYGINVTYNANYNKILVQDTATGNVYRQSAAVIDTAGASNGKVVTYQSGSYVLSTPASGIAFNEWNITGSADQSTFANDSLTGKHIEITREGFDQYVSATYGYIFSGNTITFYPSLLAGERVRVVASTASAWSSSSASGGSGTGTYLTWTNKVGTAEDAPNNGIAKVNDGNTTLNSHRAQSVETLTSGNRLQWSNGGLSGTNHDRVIGLTQATTFSGTADFKYGFYVSADNIYTIENGTASYPTSYGVLNTSAIYDIYINGTTVQYRKSTDGGSNWTVVRTSSNAASGTYTAAVTFAHDTNYFYSVQKF